MTNRWQSKVLRKLALMNLEVQFCMDWLVRITRSVNLSRRMRIISGIDLLSRFISYIFILGHERTETMNPLSNALNRTPDQGIQTKMVAAALRTSTGQPLSLGQASGQRNGQYRFEPGALVDATAIIVRAHSLLLWGDDTPYIIQEITLCRAYGPTHFHCKVARDTPIFTGG